MRGIRTGLGAGLRRLGVRSRAPVLPLAVILGIALALGAEDGVYDCEAVVTP